MVPSHSLSFGALLRHYRVAAGVTQEALAEQAGISARGVSDLERGVRRTPYRHTIEQLAGALRLTGAERETFLMASGRGGRLAGSSPNYSDPRVPITSSPPLIGRQDCLAELQRHLCASGPPLLALSGEPGIGKSRLLREAATRGQERGWTVLESGCTRRGGQEPYAPVLSAIERHLLRLSVARKRRVLTGCAWLVHLLPELADVLRVPPSTSALSPDQQRRLAFRAVERLLFNIAGPAGTLLLLDDLQWAGADALDLLGALVQPLEGAPPVRVVSAYRDADVDPHQAWFTFLTDLSREGLVRSITLGPLDTHAAAEVLDSLLPSTLQERSARIVHGVKRAEGVPFFLMCYAQRLCAGEPDIDVVPGDVKRAIHQRVLALPRSAQELVNAAAVIGREMPRTLASAMMSRHGWNAQEVLVALEAACQAQLLAEGGDDTYVFAHDLIREAVYEGLSRARQATLHHEVAAALQQRRCAPSAEVLAYHFLRAGEPEEAVPHLERAGDHAQAMHAFAEAEGYYRTCLVQALALGQSHELAHLYEKRGNALTFQDRYEEALADFVQARQEYGAHGDQEGQWRALAQIGWMHVLQGTFQAGLPPLEAVLAQVDPGQISPGLAAVHAALAFLAFGSGQYDKQLTYAEHAVRLAQALQDDALLIKANHSLSVALTMLGRPQESQPPRMETIRLAERVGDLWTLSEALNGLSSWHLQRGDFSQSKAAVERACQAAEQLDWSSNMAYMWYWRGNTAFYSGEWAEAQMHYEQAAVFGRESRDIWGLGFPAYGRGQLALAQGQREEASRYFAAARALAERSHELRLLRAIQRAQAEDDLLAGCPEAACSRLAPLLDLPNQEELSVTLFLPLLAWATLECGDSVAADALVSTCLRRAREQQVRIVVPDALRIGARLEAQHRRWTAAQRALDEALTMTRLMSYPYAEVKVLYEYGHLWRQQGEAHEACKRFEAALLICARLGERLYAQQIERALTEIKHALMHA